MIIYVNFFVGWLWKCQIYCSTDWKRIKIQLVQQKASRMIEKHITFRIIINSKMITCWALIQNGLNFINMYNIHCICDLKAPSSLFILVNSIWYPMSIIGIYWHSFYRACYLIDTAKRTICSNIRTNTKQQLLDAKKNVKKTEKQSKAIFDEIANGRNHIDCCAE